MSDIKILNKPKFVAVLIDSPVTILSQTTKVVKYDKKDEKNIPNTKKLGNFTEWEIQIFQEDRTDEDWATLKVNLKLLSTGTLQYFYPDTVDNSSIKYLSYFFIKVDEINESPVDFIWARILRYYSDGNEVII